ncbi:hypothetical protein DXM27_19565 [Rhizobium rhizogenes]|uniref:Transposase IS701-like DDE domain-containing protein n=1 Tax=Rhizobium rhizogenes TaxID=359 RepID=A0AA88F0U8_RHIRH|nr:hypothetical protein DXM27_19565 [Rhizobium rhizogenes]MQB12014.1 hypothetical protein [Agrobacterium sp. ICMP 6402]
MRGRRRMRLADQHFAAVQCRDVCRKGLRERGFTWAVGIPKHQKVYPDDARMIFPVSDHGRPRKHSIPDTLSVAVETMLASARSKKVSRKREFLRTFYN